jgi:hypothetical protein
MVGGMRCMTCSSDYCNTCSPPQMPPVCPLPRCHFAFRTSDRSEREPSRADADDPPRRLFSYPTAPEHLLVVRCHISDLRPYYSLSLSFLCIALSLVQSLSVSTRSSHSIANSIPRHPGAFQKNPPSVAPSARLLHPAHSRELERKHQFRITRPWPSLLQCKRRSTRSARRSSLCPRADLDRS